MLWLRNKQNKFEPILIWKPHEITWVLIDFSLTVKAATLIFISGRGSAISPAKEGKSFLIDWLDSLRPLNNLSVMRDVSSWVEPVLS